MASGCSNQRRKSILLSLDQPSAPTPWHRQEALAQARSTGAGKKHWLWRAVGQNGAVLDILVQNQLDKDAAKRLLRTLLKKQCRAPCVMITV